MTIAYKQSTFDLDESQVNAALGSLAVPAVGLENCAAVSDVSAVNEVTFAALARANNRVFYSPAAQRPVSAVAAAGTSLVLTYVYGTPIGTLQPLFFQVDVRPAGLNLLNPFDVAVKVDNIFVGKDQIISVAPTSGQGQAASFLALSMSDGLILSGAAAIAADTSKTVFGYYHAENPANTSSVRFTFAADALPAGSVVTVTPFFAENIDYTDSMNSPILNVLTKAAAIVAGIIK